MWNENQLKSFYKKKQQIFIPSIGFLFIDSSILCGLAFNIVG